MTTEVKKDIVERDGKFCVTSQDGSRNFGCYTSRDRAEARLRQIEHFKKDVGTSADLAANGGMIAPEQGIPRRRIRRAAEPPFSSTVDIYEGDYLVLRHVGFGDTKADAEAIIQVHAKYDTFLDAALKGKPFNDLKPRAVTKKRERSVAKVLPTTGKTAIVLLLPPDLQKKLAVQGGEAPANLHLTLGYYGRLEELRPDAIGRLVQVIQDVVMEQMSPLCGVLAGTGRFKASPTSDGKDVFYLSFDSPDLVELRHHLAEASIDAEVPLRMSHGFTPHITLAYLEPSAKDPNVSIPDDMIYFPGVTLMIEDYRLFFPFPGGPTIDAAMHATIKAEASPETALKNAYMRHLQNNGFDPGNVKADVRGEEIGEMPGGGKLYRITDGWGEWYFKDSKNMTMEWVAQKMPDVRAYAVCDDLTKAFTRDFVKSLGWGDKAWDEALVEAYAPLTKALDVMKADNEKRYTLGVAYPARQLDAHKEFMTADQLEKAAWTAVAQGLRLGIMHQRGTDGAGQVVESYIYRGPKWNVNGQVVEDGDWLVGAIWRQDVWERIKRGELTGYSMQGWAKRGT